MHTLSGASFVYLGCSRVVSLAQSSLWLSVVLSFKHARSAVMQLRAEQPLQRRHTSMALLHADRAQALLSTAWVSSTLKHVHDTRSICNGSMVMIAAKVCFRNAEQPQ